MSEEKKDIEIKEKPEEETSLASKRLRPLPTFREMSSLFDRVMNDTFYPFSIRRYEPSLLTRFEEEGFRTPLTNVSENDDEFKITAELPGLNKKDIDITITDDSLEIKGESKAEKEEEEEGYVRREYTSSSYYRTFNIPENVNKDKIDASFQNGVLNIELPKMEIKKPKSKKVEVK